MASQRAPQEIEGYAYSMWELVRGFVGWRYARGIGEISQEFNPDTVDDSVDFFIDQWEENSQDSNRTSEELVLESFTALDLNYQLGLVVAMNLNDRGPEAQKMWDRIMLTAHEINGLKSHYDMNMLPNIGLDESRKAALELLRLFEPQIREILANEYQEIAWNSTALTNIEFGITREFSEQLRQKAVPSDPRKEA